MFEKEAEERTKQYMNKYTEKYNCENSKLETDNYNAGLETGYEQGFIDGAELGYNKANEWHYVKDGDLPKEETLECLCIIRPVIKGEPFENKDFRGVLYFSNGRFYLDEDNSNDWLKETNSDFTELVIAWKEIILPELPKEKK